MSNQLQAKQYVHGNKLNNRFSFLGGDLCGNSVRQTINYLINNTNYPTQETLHLLRRNILIQLKFFPLHCEIID